MWLWLGLGLCGCGWLRRRGLAHASLRLQLAAELRCSLRSVNTDEYAPLAVPAIANLDAYRNT